MVLWWSRETDLRVLAYPVQLKHCTPIENHGIPGHEELEHHREGLEGFDNPKPYFGYITTLHSN